MKSRRYIALIMMGALAQLLAMQAAMGAPWIAVSPWTGDADSGIDSGLTYTAAYNFGNIAEDTTINGVLFTGVAGGSQDIPGVFSFDHPDANIDFTRNIHTGGSATMAVRMLNGNDSAVLQLRGLTPGQAYRTTIFGVAWEAGTRKTDFGVAGSGVSQVVDEDIFGDNNGIKVEIEFQATDLTQDITMVALVTNDTFHTYGFANAEIEGISAEPLVEYVTASSTNVYYTEPVTFAWAVAGDTDSLTVTPSIGGMTDLLALTTNGVGTIGEQITSSTSYTITATRGGETTNITYDITFNPMSIDSFGAVPTLGYEGDEVILSWGVPGAESIVISNETGEVVATNTATGSFALIQPVGTETYILTASNSAGELEVGDPVEVTIQVGTGSTPWIAASPWTGDADSGIDGGLTYTAAYNFGNIAEDTTINGVLFTGVAGGSQDVPGVFSLNHPNANIDYTRNINAGGSATMAVRMLSGNNNAVLQLRGLTPGQAYRTTIFGVAWESSTRKANFGVAGSGVSQVVDEDRYGENNGIKVEIEFEANAPTQDITIDALVGGDSFHIYGFANAEIAGISAEPLVEYISASATNVSVGGSTTFDWIIAGDADSLTVSPSISGTTNLLPITTNGVGTIVAPIYASSTYTFTVTRGGETINVAFDIAVSVPLGSVVQPVAVDAPTGWMARTAEKSMNGSGLVQPESVETGDTYATIWTTHNTDANSMYLVDPGVTPTITWDLGQSYTLTGFHLWNYNESTAGLMIRGIKTANLSYSTDGTNFTSTAVTSSEFAMASGVGAYEGETYAFTGSIEARYVRFEVLSNWGDASATGVAEIRFTAPLVVTPAELSISNDAGTLSVTASNMNLWTTNTLQGTVNLVPASWTDMDSSIGFGEKTWVLDESETYRFFRVESN